MRYYREPAARCAMKSVPMKPRVPGKRALIAYRCLFQPEPEGGFTVICPRLPPIVARGETLQEAQANAREAIELSLEVMREDPGSPLRSAGTAGNLTTDAHPAALAIEHGATVVSFDRDFARFEGVHWTLPAAE